MLVPKPQDDTRLARGWREVPCAGGTRTRKVRSYTLLHRPRAQPDLFMPS
jgi:hypothetical protein